MTDPIRLGTRASPLAQWQARLVAELLRPIVHSRSIELVLVETHGDRDQASALRVMGGFGVFTRAIQQALLDDRVDVAVHSLKDLPTENSPGTALAAVPQRGPSGDVFVSHRHRRFDELPHGARVGTSSLRRRAQLLNRRPDLAPVELRGNIDTRLRKLQDQDLDAILLAEAGVVRLGLSDAITERLDPDWMLPAVGQGAIGLECRENDREMRQLVSSISDPATWSCVSAERAMLAALGGGCLAPIGTTSNVEDEILTIRAMVLSPDGQRRIVASHRGSAETPLAIGQELAAMLLASGADELLQLAVRPGG